MKNNILIQTSLIISTLLLSVICYLLIGIKPVSAQYVSYPIAELGNCAGPRECYYYCQIPQNSPACWSYGKYILEPQVLGISTVNEEYATDGEVLATTTTSTTKVTYPIAELGNCPSALACYQYCGIEANRQKCIDYGKAKNLIKQQIQNTTIESVILKAKEILGCDSKDACMAFCSIEANQIKCKEFALVNNMPKKANPANLFERKDKDEIMSYAQRELGCTSPQECANVCAKPENRVKCFKFAQKFNLLQMKKDIIQSSPSAQMKGPGGCANEKECQEYCTKFPKDCKGFLQEAGQPTAQANEEGVIEDAVMHMEPIGRVDRNENSTPSAKKPLLNTKPPEVFLGPGGCKTDGECKAYCEKHPLECPGFPKKPYPTFSVKGPDTSRLPTQAFGRGNSSPSASEQPKFTPAAAQKLMNSPFPSRKAGPSTNPFTKPSTTPSATVQ